MFNLSRPNGRGHQPRRALWQSHYIGRMSYTRENPLTFIVPEPILLRIERVDRPGAQPGDQPVAFTRAGPRNALLAVNAYPSPLVDAFFASDAFGEPVIVVGAAWEE